MRSIYLLTAVIIVAAHWSPQTLRSFRLSGTAQGTSWHLNYFAVDSVIGKQSIDSILVNIDSALSLYKDYSTIVEFNNSRRGVRGNVHLLQVARRSMEVSKHTAGLFDITVAPLVHAWGFGPNSVQSTPSAKHIRCILDCVGYRKLAIIKDSLIKTTPCLSIDMNGIAQGYTVDALASYLRQRGLRNYIVELGGEVRVSGSRHPGGEPFRIGIEAPGVDNFTAMQKVVYLRKGALTTSGNYRKFRENGSLISHTIHPVTGYPVKNEIISATVYAPDAITADAYDNAVMLMGVNDAISFVDKNPPLAAYIIYTGEGGVVRDTVSSRFKKLLSPGGKN
jgi:thiamine biosynthesis lipoprotein